MKNNKIKKATIKDVASMANVSAASVSRYLNGITGHLSTQKSEAISRAIKLLNYVPNAVARQMVTQKSKMIAVIVANIDDYFSTEVFKGASSILKNQGYQALLLDTNARKNEEKDLLKMVNNNSFDGLLFQPLASNVKMIKKEVVRDIPIVILDRELEGENWPQVVTNNFNAAKNATAYFLMRGYKDILILSSKIAIASTRKKRYEGVLSVVQKEQIHTIEIDEETYNHDEIQKKIENFLKQQKRKQTKTLIFCFKERWLLEFIPSLTAKHILDPSIIQVTGFADTKVSQSLLPTARLISQNPYLMGASAAEILLNRLITDNTSTTIPQSIVIKAKF